MEIYMVEYTELGKQTPIPAILSSSHITVHAHNWLAERPNICITQDCQYPRETDRRGEKRVVNDCEQQNVQALTLREGKRGGRMKEKEVRIERGWKHRRGPGFSCLCNWRYLVSGR